VLLTSRSPAGDRVGPTVEHRLATGIHRSVIELSTVRFCRSPRPADPRLGNDRHPRGERFSHHQGVAMNAPEKEPTQHKPGSVEARRLVAAVGAWACIGVAVIAAVVFLLS
jgi:hypothetical protein